MMDFHFMMFCSHPGCACPGCVVPPGADTGHGRGTSGRAGIPGHPFPSHPRPSPHRSGDAHGFCWRGDGRTCVPRLWEVEQGIGINQSPFPCQDFALMEHFVLQREGFGSVHSVLAWS